MELCGYGVEGRRFHFHGQDAVLAQAVVIHIVIIEAVTGKDIANFDGQVHLLGILRSAPQQGEVRNGCVIHNGAEDAFHHAGIRGRGLGNQHIFQVQVFVHGTAGAHPDEFLAAEDLHQLVGVDGDGGHAHAGGLDGDRHSLVSARIAEIVAYMRIFHSAFKKIFGNEFGSQGISRQQDALGYLAAFGGDMWCTHGKSTSFFSLRNQKILTCL